MKHTLFLRRRRNLRGHIWRWPSLPNTAAKGPEQPSGRSLASADQLSPTPVSRRPRPTRPLRAVTIYEGSLGPVIGGRWLRGPESAKGTRPPTWSLSTTSPGAARRAPLEVAAGTPVLRGSAKRLLLPRAPLVRRDSSPAASPRLSVRETRPHSDPQAPALLGHKPGSRNRLQDTGLRPLRPPGPSPTES